MAEPPPTPPSSDITGAQRDEPKLVAARESADAGDLEQLAEARSRSSARPLEDKQIASKGNSQ